MTVEESEQTGSAKRQLTTKTICVVGLGYVGLPLAIRFDSVGSNVIGYDVSSERIRKLRAGYDPTGDLGDITITDSTVHFTTDPARISQSDYILITVPTPIDNRNNPDLKHVKTAGRTIGHNISEETIVVLESTVFPGATREILGPAIEETSELSAEEHFYLGYSPERLVPGDEEHTLENVVKIVSGQDDEILEDIAELYETIVDAGVHRAPEIEVAEAAKCFENIQRDLNIALVNELSITCNTLNIDTDSVLEAAGTKWNFHDYDPGLVGGHCIPVDPFFLIYKSEKKGFEPELVQKAREVNEYMPKHVGKETIKALNESGKVISESRVLVLGLTYKADVADIRTSMIGGTISKLQEFNAEVVGFDPNASDEFAKAEFGINIQESLSFQGFDAVIIGAAHKEFSELDLEKAKKELETRPILVDTENVFEHEAKKAGIKYWKL